MPCLLRSLLVSRGTDDERARVRKLAMARHAPADWVLRARIVAASWDGLEVAEIAGLVGCHARTVRSWITGSTPKAWTGSVTEAANAHIAGGRRRPGFDYPGSIWDTYLRTSAADQVLSASMRRTRDSYAASCSHADGVRLASHRSLKR